MADEEKVLYSYEGDTSSLKKATEEAISMLDNYEKALRKSAKLHQFGADTSPKKNFESAIAKMQAEVARMQKRVAKVGDVKLPFSGKPQQAFAKSLSTMQSQLGRLAGSEEITTKSLKRMTTQLNSSRTAIRASVGDTNNLINSEKRFQKILGTVEKKATQVSVKFEQSKERIAKLFEPISQRTQAFKGMFNRHLQNIIGRVKGFRDIAQTAFTRVGKLAGAVASAFRRTSQAADASGAAASKSAKKHLQLSAVWKTIQKAGTAVSKTFGNLTKKLAPVVEVLKKVSQVVKKVTSGMSALLTKVKNTAGKLRSFISSTKRATASTKLFKTAVTGLSAVKLAEWLSKSINLSIQYVENLNLFKVAMGSAADSAMKFVNQMAEVYGLDPNNILRSAGYLYQLSDAISMPSDAAETLSLSLTKAATDIASLFNVDVETVIENLASGMQGMTRAVRKYGIDVRASTLQTIALKYGITESVDSMSEANRQALRYIAIIEQTTNATHQYTIAEDGAVEVTGDFANTIETPANQLRIFKEQMTRLGRVIGDFFIQPLAEAMVYINGFTMALRNALQYIAIFAGIDLTDLGGTADSLADEAEAISDVGDAAAETTKQINKMLAPFDELNILTENAGYTSLDDEVLDPALLKAIQSMELSLEDVQMRANQVRDALLDFLGLKVDASGSITFDKDLFKNSLLNHFPEWEAEINDAFESWDLSGIGKITGILISEGFEQITKYISWNDSFASVIANVQTYINSALSTLDGTSIGGAIGAAVNTGVQASYSFIAGIDWKGIGRIIADSMNTALQSIDWTTAGRGLVVNWNALIMMLSTAVANVDWAAVASAITEGLYAAVNSIQIERLAAGLGNLIQGLITIIYNLMVNMNWGDLGSRLGNAFMTLWNSIDWGTAGEAISRGIQGILRYIEKAISAIDWQKVGEGIADFLSSINWAGLSRQFVTTANAIIVELIKGLIACLPAIIKSAGSIISGLVQGIIDSLPTLLPATVNIIMAIVVGLAEQLPLLVACALQLVAALAIGLIEALPKIIEVIPTLINAIVNAIVENLPLIIELGIQLFVALIDNLPAIIEAILVGVGDILQNIIEAILLALPDINQAGIDLFVAIVEDLPTIIGIILDSIIMLTDEIIKALIGASPELTAAGVKIFVSLVANMPKITYEILKAIGNLLVAIYNSFSKAPERFAEIGLNMIKGLWNGIKGATQWLKDKISGVFNNILDWARSIFDEHSPSKEFAKIGDFAVRGLAEGFTSKAPIKAITSVTNDVMAAMTLESGFNDMWSHMLKSAETFTAKLETRLNSIELMSQLATYDVITNFGVSGSSAIYKALVAPVAGTSVETAGISTTNNDNASVPSLLREMLALLRQGQVIVVDDTVLGRVVKKSLGNDFRSAGYTTLDI